MLNWKRKDIPNYCCSLGQNFDANHCMWNKKEVWCMTTYKISTCYTWNNMQGNKQQMTSNNTDLLWFAHTK